MKHFLIFLVVWVGLVAPAGTEAREQQPPPDEIGPKARLTAPGEPGQPLRIRGVVKQRATDAPVAAATIYVYHADADGYYAEKSLDDSKPRIYGYLETDADGRFEIETIRPGSYPYSREAQHVHYLVTTEALPREYGEIHFDDDPLVTDVQRKRSAARYDPVVEVRRAGEWEECEVVLWIGPR